MATWNVIVSLSATEATVVATRATTDSAIHLLEQPTGGVQAAVSAGTLSDLVVDTLVVKIVLCDHALTFPIVVGGPAIDIVGCDVAVREDSVRSGYQRNLRLRKERGGHAPYIGPWHPSHAQCSQVHLDDSTALLCREDETIPIDHLTRNTASRFEHFATFTRL